jgi:hypothetical protein
LVYLHQQYEPFKPPSQLQSLLTLTLLMTWIFAYDANHAFATDYLTL